MDTPIVALANLNLQDDNQNPEPASPNAMAIDNSPEHIVEMNGPETENVAIINPDAMDTDAVLASDCTFALPPPSVTSSMLIRPR